MTKPTLESFYAIAIKNQLDYKILTFKEGFMGDIERRREDIVNLMEQYKELTGRNYVYEPRKDDD